MLKLLLDLIFPIQCLGCGKEKEFFCEKCLNKIPLNFDFPRRIKEDSLDNIITATHYNDPLIKKIIFAYKYEFVKDLAKPLGQLIVKKLSYCDLQKQNTALIPVPLHKKRLRWRGFNQSDLLAQEVGKELNIPVLNNLLIRDKNNLPQAKIRNAEQRKKNIKASFCLNKYFPENLKDKNIILIDDVCTTGATLNECAIALRPLKPQKIWAITLAGE